MLTENYLTHISLSQSASSSMQLDTDNTMDSTKMKDVVEEILVTEGYADERAAKMAINDFLALLAAFNARGIHFT